MSVTLKRYLVFILAILFLLLLVAALGLIGAALNLFWRRRTRPEPWQPASALVVTGIYRFTRNPMYLGMTLLSLSVAIFCQSLGAVFLSLVAAALIDRFVICREEAIGIEGVADEASSFSFGGA